jgi:hypothetical protein
MLVLPFAAGAQQLERWVMASSGGYWQAGNLQMSYTLGETFTKDHSAATLFVLSGFQQGDATSGIGLDPVQEVQASVYPNPSTGRFYVDVEAGITAHLRIFNVQGAEVWQQMTVEQWPWAVDLTAMPTGTYFLEITGANNNLSGRVKLLKQ